MTKCVQNLNKKDRKRVATQSRSLAREIVSEKFRPMTHWESETREVDEAEIHSGVHKVISAFCTDSQGVWGKARVLIG